MSGLAGLAVIAKAKSVASSIPRQVWLALAVALLIGLGVWMHHRAVKNAYSVAYGAGKADEAARIEAKAKKLAAEDAKRSAKLRSQNDETNRRIVGDARTVFVRGAGKASCIAPAPTSASGRKPPAGQTSAAVDQVPPGEGLELIGLPFAGAVALAEEHDLCIAEATTWREDKRLQIENWEKANR